MSSEENSRSPRGRSARYPGVSLADALELARLVDDRGLDGLTSAEIAAAAGYKNIKTNTFSSRLSATRQFGLLGLREERYELTPLARSLLHPSDSAQVGRLRREAFLTAPLYAELTVRLAGKKVPDATILANLLYHHHQITPSAKGPAAEAFLESARFAGLIGGDGILQADGAVVASSPTPSVVPTVPPPQPAGQIRFDLRLWDEDKGKLIRVRCPESITSASFERFLQAFRLHVKVEDGGGSAAGSGSAH